MICEKYFEDLKTLNDFISNNNIKVINIENVEKVYDTGLPTLRGDSFSYLKNLSY